MSRFLTILVCLSVLWAAAAAQAQEPLLHSGKTGITAATGLRVYSQMPFLAAEDLWVGMIFHVVPAIALRPSLILFKLDGETTDNLTPASSTTSSEGGLGVALGALYFLPSKSSFRLYFGPEVKYRFSSETAFFDNGDKQSDTRTQQFNAAALFGAQYMLGERFGFHADVGIGMLRYSRAQKEWNAAGTVITDEEEELTGGLLRPAYLGAVFYFN